MSDPKDLNEIRKRLEELDEVQVRRNRYYWWLLLIPFLLGIAYVIWTSRQADAEAGKLAVVKGEEIARGKIEEVETRMNQEIDGLRETVSNRDKTIVTYRSDEEDLVATFAKQFPGEPGVSSIQEVAHALERLDVSGQGSPRPSCPSGHGCYSDSIWTQYLNLKDLWQLERAGNAARTDSLAQLRNRIAQLDEELELRNRQIDYLLYRLEYERSIPANLTHMDGKGQSLEQMPDSESMKLRQMRKALKENETPMILNKISGALRKYAKQEYRVQPEVARTQDDVRAALNGCPGAKPLQAGEFYPPGEGDLHNAPVRKFEPCP